MYKKDLALKNLHGSICRKTQPAKNKQTIPITSPKNEERGFI